MKIDMLPPKRLCTIAGIDDTPIVDDLRANKSRTCDGNLMGGTYSKDIVSGEVVDGQSQAVAAVASTMLYNLHYGDCGSWSEGGEIMMMN